jgi:hypothetical protein
MYQTTRVDFHRLNLLQKEWYFFLEFAMSVLSLILTDEINSKINTNIKPGLKILIPYVIFTIGRAYKPPVVFIYLHT